MAMTFARFALIIALLARPAARAVLSGAASPGGLTFVGCSLSDWNFMRSADVVGPTTPGTANSFCRSLVSVSSPVAKANACQVRMAAVTF